MRENKILTELPVWKNGRYKGKINWREVVGRQLDLLYNGNIFVITVVKYDKLNLWVDYNGYIYSKGISTGSFINGGFGNILKLNTREFKINVGQVFKDEKRDLAITDREYRINKNGRKQKYYKYTCNKCGYDEGWIEESDLITKRVGCACCAGVIVVPEINSIYVKASWMMKWISEEDAKKYTKGSGKKVEIICPDCSRKKKKSLRDIYNNKSIGCFCSDKQSYISKYIISVLDQLKVKYDTEAKYDWNKYDNPLTNKKSQASIDFIVYKDEREIPLEADGAFHRSDNKMNGMTKEQVKNIDKQRDENCLKYLGEETIRISDEGDVKENILNSKLSEEFDLSKVDWNKCEEYAMSNLVKNVCNYWNNKQEWETTTDLCKVFNFDKSTIIDYLKRGTSLGWCDYNPKEELIKSGKRTGLKYVGSCNIPKPIEMFKDEQSLGVFESASHLSRISEDLLGVKLIRRGISNVCNGERKQYKGFTFKYI